MRGCRGVAPLPALQPGQCILFALCATDLDQRMFGCAAARRLHARRLIGLLLVLRRPRRVAEPLALMTRRQLEQRRERARLLVDRFVPVADLGEAWRSGCARDVGWVGCVDVLQWY